MIENFTVVSAIGIFLILIGTVAAIRSIIHVFLVDLLLSFLVWIIGAWLVLQ